jgi:hypothetical protein
MEWFAQHLVKLEPTRDESGYWQILPIGTSIDPKISAIIKRHPEIWLPGNRPLGSVERMMNTPVQVIGKPPVRAFMDTRRVE